MMKHQVITKQQEVKIMSTATVTRLTRTINYDVIRPYDATAEQMADFLDGTGYYFFTDRTPRPITGTLLPVAGTHGRPNNISDGDYLVKRDGQLLITISETTFNLPAEELLAHLSRKVTVSEF